MDTKINDSKQGEGKKKELMTHGNKKKFFSHFATGTISAAIGVTIAKAIPINQKDAPTPQQTPFPNPVSETEEKSNDHHEEKVPEKEVERLEDTDAPSNKEDINEPVPTDTTDSARTDKPEENSNEQPESKPDAKSEETPDVKSDNQPEKRSDDLPNEKEIDEIADNLVKDSKIDERDNVGIPSDFSFTQQVELNLPNGLTAEGFVFELEGNELVLADLDGDGIFDDLLANTDNGLAPITVDIVGTDGRVERTLNDFIAQNHLTESDIVQVATDDADINQAMTDVERKQMENDTYLEDVALVDENTNEIRKAENEADLNITNDKVGTLAREVDSDNDFTDIDQELAELEKKLDNGKEEIKELTEEEENELLKDILGGTTDDDLALEDDEIDTLIESIIAEDEDSALQETFNSQQADVEKDVATYDLEDIDFSGIGEDDNLNS